MTTDYYAKVISEVQNDPWIKIAGIDADGVLRGKDIANSKFMKAVQKPFKGLGMCSVIFGWDITDELYHDETLPTSNIQLGYPDLIAKVDLDTYRRIPWENNMPFFLVSFYNAETMEPVTLCPRNVLSVQLQKAKSQLKVQPLAGVEYEFFHYRNEKNSLNAKGDPQLSSISSLPHLSAGMFTYSLIRPAENKAYYQAIKDATLHFECPIDGLHTESGPVYEASLAYDTMDKIADRGVLFKYLIKCIAHDFDITPTFMAKPLSQMPGNSGHVHISLVDSEDPNRKVFDRQTRDDNPPFQALEYISNEGRSFLAGLLEGIPHIMPLLCPTINSYKRLGNCQFWTASSVSWGIENRNASIRVVTGGASGGTRFECRVPGADASAPYVLAALLGCGLWGMEKKLNVKIPPLEQVDSRKEKSSMGERQSESQKSLSRTLKEAVIDMTREDSIAREVLGDDFVEQFAATRLQEVRCFEDSVTDWEISRYLERV